MGVLAQALLGRADADQGEELARTRFGLVALQAAVDAKRFADLEAHGEGRVQAGHGLLKDHAHAIASERADPRLLEREEVGPAEQDTARLDAARRRGQQPHQRHRGDALAATRFADETDRLARSERERDVLDHADARAFGRAERDREVLDLDERARRRRGGDGLRRGRRVAARALVPHSKTSRGK